MSTRSALFFLDKGNIFILGSYEYFCVIVSAEVSFSQVSIEYEYFFIQIYLLIYVILTGTTTPGQSGPEDNGKKVILYTIQIWSFTTRCSLVSNQGNLFF